MFSLINPYKQDIGCDGYKHNDVIDYLTLQVIIEKGGFKQLSTLT